MKKLLSILIAGCILLMSISNPVLASEPEISSPVISQMTDDELLAFLSSHGVEIPSGLAESQSDAIEMTRSWIVEIENDPNIAIIFNLTSTNEFLNKLKEAVNDYYGIDTTASIMPYSSHGLQDSTVYQIPSDMGSYNCYGYALGKKQLCDPGKFSGHGTLSNTDIKDLSIYALASYVKEDLQSSQLGQSCVKLTSVRPTTSTMVSGQTAICIRKGDDGRGSYDYHFMRLFSSVWRHKPGTTAILTYDYMPSVSRNWLCEGYDGTTVMTSNLKYNSDIYYILYKPSHSYVNKYTGVNYHSGSTHHYQYADVCTGCGDIRPNTTSWVVRSCSGPPCNDITRVRLEIK